MDKSIANVLLVHLTAQTELLGVIARYHAGIRDRNFVEEILERTLVELRDVSPDAVEIFERIGAPAKKNLFD